MKLILITYPKAIPNEAGLLVSMFEEGLTRLHIRKPGISMDDLRKYIKAIPEQYHSCLMLHQHFELVNEFKLGGVSFNKKHPPCFDLLDGKGLIYAQSAHSMQELRALDERIDYALLSPIFDSISKDDYASNFKNRTLLGEDLELFKKKNSTEVIALGGIDKDNIHKVKYFGFHGSAVLGYVWRSVTKKDKPERAINKIKKLLEKCQDNARYV